MNLEILDSSAFGQWNDFLNQHPLGTIYHSVEWLRIIEKTYGYKPLILVRYDETGRISAGIAGSIVCSKLQGKRFSSIPCAQQANPLVSDHESILSIFKDIEQTLKNLDLGSCEIKMDRSVLDEECAVLKAPNRDYCTYILSLDEPFELLKKRFHKDCILRAVAKAKKLGVQVVEASSNSDIEIFYRLHTEQRKTDGLLPQPLTFFKNLWNTLYEKKAVEMFHAVFNGDVISTILLIKSKNMVTYEYGATKTGKKYLNPSPLLLQYAIEKASIAGFAFFDFGRCSMDDSGLKVFKARWGAIPKQLFYYSFPAYSVPQIRKESFLKIIMSLVVRNSPMQFNVFLGKLLYKHFI